MFKFVPIETFTAPVTLITPGGEAQTFKAVFSYLDDKANDEAVKLDNTELLRNIWKGWSEINDDQDKPLPYSDDQRELFLRHTYITNAVVTAYVNSRAGLRPKN